ncbi:MAG: hypothetical protein KF817_13900 [Phycisphaeraceae bacterium]|nr:hypothetical protein [Phycisphaeraceae bacterium]
MTTPDPSAGTSSAAPPLRRIRPEAIPRALTKAERYRLLNEPRTAESICRDILAVAPDNQEATATLLLAITDQFRHGWTSLADAERVLRALRDTYARHYYLGVALERWAKALLDDPAQRRAAAGFFSAAMRSYDRAHALATAGNDDAVLRWNTCVRIMERNHLEFAPGEAAMDLELEGFEDEVPPRAPFG